MSEYRDEVEHAIASDEDGSWRVLRANDIKLIELGVRLGLQAAAQAVCDTDRETVGRGYMQQDDAAATLRSAERNVHALSPADVLSKREGEGKP